MTKINIVDTFNTSLGRILMVEEGVYRIGEDVIDQQGICYVIKGIKAPTRPTENNLIGLIV